MTNFCACGGRFEAITTSKIVGEATMSSETKIVCDKCKRDVSIKERLDGLYQQNSK